MPVNFQILLDFLPLGPKHPVRDKFNEVHFLEDVNKFVGELRENKSEVEKFCEIETSAKRYAKNVHETPKNGGAKRCMIIQKPRICLRYHLTKTTVSV